jgi:transposase
MPILADRADVVVGVDTHTDTHSAAVLTAVGVVLDQLTVTADQSGQARLLAWAGQHTPGLRRAWVIDGARSHGVGLTRYLRRVGEEVIEGPRVGGQARRRGGKSDALDAIHAARTALAASQVATPRGDGDREALRILLVCRRHYSDTRTATVNLFKSLILTADDDLRAQLRALTTAGQVAHVAGLDPCGEGLDQLTRVRRQRLAALAADITGLDQALKANKAELQKLAATMCPVLLEQPGVGPVTAGTALTAWSHKDRLRSEAAFAALAGVNPVPASSGRTVRHRLNRGGDRTLNAALHTIVITRRRDHQPTRDYVTRRTAEGLTDREINRCLKRYVARQLFRIMQTSQPAAAVAASATGFVTGSGHETEGRHQP